MRCVVNVGCAENEAVGTRRASRLDRRPTVSPTFGVGCGIFSNTIVKMEETYRIDRSRLEFAGIGDGRGEGKVGRIALW